MKNIIIIIIIVTGPYRSSNKLCKIIEGPGKEYLTLLGIIFK